MLIDLIAGRERITTFLALLERETFHGGVKIIRYQPQSPSVAVPDESRDESKVKRNKEQTLDTSLDPMTELGYQESAISLEVHGGFAAPSVFS